METLFIGKNTIFLHETESTNSYAINLLKNVKLPEGTLVYTGKQTKGKGQRGSTWNAEVINNVTVSYILNPSFLDLKNQHYLYQIAALACYDTTAELLDSSQIDIKIKWPNDILVNGKKLCGILIENSLNNDRLNWSVIGVGFNVNQTYFEGLEKACSLKQITSKTFRVEEVMKTISSFLEKRYLDLKANKLPVINSAYTAVLHGLNKRLKFQVKGNTVFFSVKGISNTGLLVLEDDKCKKWEFDVKEITWLE